VSDGLVFVTVGNGKQSFRRLLAAVDDLKRGGEIAQRVVMQIGNSPDFVATSCDTVAFMPYDDFTRHVAEAKVVVSHAGAGTLLHVLGAGKVPVVMPRLRQHDEIVDDHQVELAEALANAGRVFLARDRAELAAALVGALRAEHRVAPSPPPIIGIVAAALEELGGSRTLRRRGKLVG
jgi:beta-1,4-N-acetylglucosaminyltransferase